MMGIRADYDNRIIYITFAHQERVCMFMACQLKTYNNGDIKVL